MEIIEVVKKGKRISVPDFYPRMFPDLYKAEINRQLVQSHPSNLKLHDSTKNYMNRQRKYQDIHRDIQTMMKKNDQYFDEKSERSL